MNIQEALPADPQTDTRVLRHQEHPFVFVAEDDTSVTAAMVTSDPGLALVIRFGTDATHVQMLAHNTGEPTPRTQQLGMLLADPAKLQRSGLYGMFKEGTPMLIRQGNLELPVPAALRTVHLPLRGGVTRFLLDVLYSQLPTNFQAIEEDERVHPREKMFVSTLMCMRGGQLQPAYNFTITAYIRQEALDTDKPSLRLHLDPIRSAVISRYGFPGDRP